MKSHASALDRILPDLCRRRFFVSAILPNHLQYFLLTRDSLRSLPASPPAVLCVIPSDIVHTLSSDSHFQITSLQPSMPLAITDHTSMAPPPLSSPSLHEQKQFFQSSPHRPRPSFSQPAKQAQSCQQPQNPLASTQESQQAQSYGVDFTKGGVNDPAASTTFLRDFNLVAEAAKRAQMAVLMRDLGDVTL